VRIITRDGMFIEGEFTPEQLATIIERAGIEGPKDSAEALTPENGAVEATSEEAAQAKEPERLWVDTKPKRPEPEPEKPRGEVIGGINDTKDPHKGDPNYFQFQMPPREE
jgi:hypothetical protein